MNTGEVVRHFGIYSDECCDKEIELDELDVFPRCPTCHRKTVWDCVETQVLAMGFAA